ncbi:MAG: cytochrome b/b6 domain-containing protein [Bdellovibrionota bacterium]
MSSNQQIKVYDLPTRIFHWIFAIFFSIAFYIAKEIDDDSIYFPYHMIIGLMICYIVILRGVWGICGSRYAKFSSFKLNPMDLKDYFFSLFGGKTRRDLGHNPASSYSAVAMMVVALCLAISGILMSREVNKEFFEEVHELFANGFFVLAILHICGVLFHQLKHKDGMIFSMFTGTKQNVEGSVGIQSTYKGVAVLFVGLLVAFILYVRTHYDQDKRNLNFFGVYLNLGEMYDHEEDHGVDVDSGIIEYHENGED